MYYLCGKKSVFFFNFFRRKNKLKNKIMTRKEIKYLINTKYEK